MRLLLDTHIWLWSLLDPTRLGKKIRRTLEDPDTELWLSPISTWEFAMLVEYGRIEINTEIEEWVADAMTLAPLNEAPLTHEIAIRSRSVQLPHKDPADRFIAATALVLDLTLVTADARLLAAKTLPTMANR